MKRLILIALFLMAGCIVVFVPALLEERGDISSVTAPADAEAGEADSSRVDDATISVHPDPPTSDSSAKEAAEPTADEDSRAEEPHVGMGVFLSDRCDMCHTVYSGGIGRPAEEPGAAEDDDSMDLSELGSERNVEWLRGYLRKELDIDGVTHYRAFKGTDEEEAALIAWLLSNSTPADTLPPEVEEDESPPDTVPPEVEEDESPPDTLPPEREAGEEP